MHREPEQFVASVKRQYPEFFTGKKVLEVGSLDINGSVRKFFENCDYTGIDLGPGRGVDYVCHATKVDKRYDGEFDVVISAEALEHDDKWNESLVAMLGLLKDGGLLITTCAAPNRPEHGTTRTGSANASPFTSDYYRNISVEDFASVLPANLFSKSYLGYRGDMDDLYFAGIKQPVLSLEQHIAEFHAALDRKDTRTVTAEISTKDRYHTLSLTVAAILNQTHKPERLVIYDDGEQKDLRELSPFNSLLSLAGDLGVQWVFYSTERKGQVANHQHALDEATTDLIWRLDDDTIPEPNCLENLLAEMKDGVGAVAGLVHHPNGVMPLPEHVKGTLEDVTRGVNLQWFQFNSAPRQVEHLYSTFLYSVEAARKAGGYPKELSTIGHREETIFSHSIKRAGYSLIVTPFAKTWHLQEKTGGIRSYSDASLWQHDEVLFQEYLRTIGRVTPDNFMVVLNMGIGDHLCFKSIFPDLRRKHPERKWTLSVCYADVFDDVEDVTIISIAEAELIMGDRYEDEFSFYSWCWKNGKTNQPITKSMLEFWG